MQLAERFGQRHIGERCGTAVTEFEFVAGYSGSVLTPFTLNFPAIDGAVEFG